MTFLLAFTLLLIAIITDLLGIDAPTWIEEDIERLDKWLGDGKDDE